MRGSGLGLGPDLGAERGLRPLLRRRPLPPLSLGVGGAARAPGKWSGLNLSFMTAYWFLNLGCVHKCLSRLPPYSAGPGDKGKNRARPAPQQSPDEEEDQYLDHRGDVAGEHAEGEQAPPATACATGG